MRRTLLIMAVVVAVTSARTFAHTAVDMGLSVKWASYNVGAAESSQLGLRFAWGELSTKESFTFENYKHREGETQWSLDIGKEISGTKHDVASKLWGGEWRMPTQGEVLELCKKCTWEWKNVNGNCGFEVTGPNGNSIFLPADSDNNQEGHYWTGTLSQGLGRSAIELYFLSNGVRRVFGSYRKEGFHVRPVMTDDSYDRHQDIPVEWRTKKYSRLVERINAEDYEMAFVEASVLAASGDSMAQCVLGAMYYYGAGVFRNYEAAQEQLVLSASNGCARAEYMLGCIESLNKARLVSKMLTGADKPDEGVDESFWNQMMCTETLPSNFKEAFRWFFLKDGQWGYRDIMYYSGIALITGKYGYSNPQRGLYWIQRSANQGCSEAIQLLNELKRRMEK